MRDHNSGTPSAEEIQKMEKELDQDAQDNLKEDKPSDIDITDDDEDEKPLKKEDKSKKKKDDDDKEDEDEDIEEDLESEDDDDIDEDDKDLENEDEDEEDEPKGEKKTPAWKIKMQERRFNKKLDEAREELREEFEEKYGRKPNKEEKKDIEDNLIESFKEEFGVEPDEQTTKFLNWIEKRNEKTKPSPEFLERMQKIEKDALVKAEEIGYETDFSKQKKLVEKLFPEADEKAINRIKAKVKELAYTERYAKYSLEDIIRLNRKTLAPVERKKTGEPSKGGAGQARYTADMIDPEKIDWDTMSVDEAEKVMSQLEKQQGKKNQLKIYRRGKAIN